MNYCKVCGNEIPHGFVKCESHGARRGIEREPKERELVDVYSLLWDLDAEMYLEEIGARS